MDVTWARHSDLNDRVEVELCGMDAGVQVYANEFFLHQFKDEQRKRFLWRIDNPEKNWKLRIADVEERKL